MKLSYLQDNDIELTDFLLDARDLVTKYQTSISRSAYQIYLCMLHLERGQSSIADHYRSNAVSDIKIERFGNRPIKGHTERVHSVSFSSDGERVVSGSGDGTIKIWNSITGRLVAGPFEGHTDWVHSVSFSPDGKHVASGSKDRTIRIWDAITGRLVTGPFKGHTGYIHSVSFSPNGKCVASGSDDKTIRIWDTATGNLVARPFEGHTGSVLSVAFSPDGKRVASGSKDRTIRIWDTTTGKPVAGPFEGHTDWVHSVSFSPDGERVVAGSDDGTIRIWEAANENCIACPFDGHTNFSRFAAYKSEATSVTSELNIETAEIRSNLSNDAVLRDCLPQESLQTRSGSSSTCGTDMTVCDSHDNPEVAWSLEDDGWIKGELGEYLLWIPEDLRRYICKPGDGAFATQKKLGYCLKVNIYGK